MDRFTAMRAFVAVAELRGFAPAARRLRMSPPALTRTIAALEAQLTVQLLKRTTRQVSLTDAGARFLERARRIVTEVEEAERSARAERLVPTGRMVVAAPAVFGRREVAPLVCDFMARFPGVTVELTLADRMVNLVDEGVDVAVRIGHLVDSALHARLAGATRRVVVAAPGYLEKHHAPRSPADVASHVTVQFTSLTPTPEWRFHHNGREERISIAPSLVTNSADAAIGHARRSGGLAMVLAYQVKDLLKSGALQVVLQRFEPPPLPINLVYVAARHPPAAVRALVDLTLATRRWNFVDLG